MKNKIKSNDATYINLYDEIQQKVTNEFYQIMTEKYNGISPEEEKEKEIAFITKEIQSKKANFSEYSEAELVKKLYNDISGYSILTEYLEDENVEGIDINAWNNIRVTYNTGKTQRVKGFTSPEQAKNIMENILRPSKRTIDASEPAQEASIGSNIRITAVIKPILDDEVGVAAYIRQIREKVFSEKEYIEKGFAVLEQLELIQTAIKRGISILFYGSVNTGKTTAVKHFLAGLPNDMKIVTIETGSREMNLVKKDNDDNPINNVVHFLTREDSEKENRNITQEKLVVKALRFNPIVLSVAEMRDTEAYAAVEASNSGHTVVSTIHSGSAKKVYRRIANLSRKRYATDFHTALIDAVDAFPLVVQIHTTDDNMRRIVDITEAYIDDNDKVIYNTLWQYDIEKNEIDANGKVTVTGKYCQVNTASDELLQQMQRYGASVEELELFHKK